MALIFSCQCTLLAHTIEAGYAAGVNLLMAFLFAFVGPRMFSRMKRAFALQNNPKERILMRRVGILSVVCCVSFFLRGLVLLLAFWIFTTPASAFIVTCCYLLFLEMLPELAILFVLGKRTKPKKDIESAKPGEKSPLLGHKSQDVQKTKSYK
eukprot:Phypoly_transcript_21415.p1 GENE.Phypoly_transcript_21415~~Phypoly_transcript_21415.p1  ORF type:complete len:175 (+),score=7.34 Phypoly_transcript_21415:69-527(+)